MGNDKVTSVETTVRFSNFEVLNSEFTRARCNIFYTGRNRNYSDITDEALNDFIERKGYANVPIVAHLIKKDDGTYTIGGHDQTIVLSGDSIELIDETVPFGVIPEDCNPSMDVVTERSGEKREYFSVDIILWTHRYPILEAAYNDEIYFNQSMELKFLITSYDGDYVVVHKFSMSALCLLNRSMNSSENIEPCFESSVVKKFSIDEKRFKENFEMLLEKLKLYEKDTVHENPMEGDTKMMKLSDFAEILSTVKIEDSEDIKYALLDASDTQVYVIDTEDYKPYGFEYITTTIDDIDSIVIDFDSKVEMSLSATDKITEKGFTEFSIESAIESGVERGMDVKVNECTNSLNAKYDALQAQYEELIASYETAMNKINEYESLEKAAQRETHISEINDLFEKYSDKLGKCAEFLVYKARINPDEITTEELEQKLTLMVGKYMMSNSGKSTFSYTPNISGVDSSTSKTVSDRYGNLLDGYMK